MKDKNGIEINCENCKHCKDCDDKLFPDYCDDKFFPDIAKGCDSCNFEVSNRAYETRIAELQNELNIVQESERAEAQEADRLRVEVKELKKENERLSKEIIDLGTGTLAEKNYQSEIKQIQNPSESFYQRYSGVSEEYALGALEECATEADALQARVKDLESKLTEMVKLLGERGKEEESTVK